MIDAERGARLYQDTHMAQYRSTSATARPQNPMASRVRCPASFQHEIPASEGNPQVPLGGCGIVAAFLAMPVLRRLVMRRIDLPSCSVMVTPKLRDDNITLVANARSSPPLEHRDIHRRPKRRQVQTRGTHGRSCPAHGSSSGVGCYQKR